MKISLHKQHAIDLEAFGSGGLTDTAAQIIFNADWPEGMGTSIRAGIRQVESSGDGETDAALVLLCDQPFITSAVINRIIEHYREKQAAIVASRYESNGRTVDGVPALFHRTVFSELVNLNGTVGAKAIITRFASAAGFVPVPEAAIDLDTLEEYRQLRLTLPASEHVNTMEQEVGVKLVTFRV